MILNERIIQDTIKLVKELCVLLQPLHPIQTLQRAYCEFICQNFGIKKEFEIGAEAVHSGLFLEYLQSLFISIDLKENLRPPTDEKEWKNIKEKVKQIYENCGSPFIINQDDNTISQEDKLLFSQIWTLWMQIRGNRHIIYEHEHLNKLLTPHKEILKELYHVTVEDILDGLKKILKVFIFFPKILKESYEAQKEIQNFYGDLKKKSLSDEDIKRRLQDKIIELQLENKIDRRILNIQKITGWPERFIEKISASIGSHKSFLIQKPHNIPEHLLATTQPIVRKPVLKYDKKFHLFSLRIFLDPLSTL